ncbi:DNA cytosine methyltransferase [Amorphus sp. 3PC139-8]|uniref:DNA cytosine methyltransferase n=1 Tax=Amorphus sp. 3PC139-8 TaxID=2735676 RepID=UPI00345CDB80
MRQEAFSFGEPSAPSFNGRELIVDSFAGGGGASLGIEMALGRSPDYAINHDDAALAMHAANHPETIHLPHNVWQVSLKDIVGQQPIGLLWMSPDCRHHSKAKGGAPVSPSVRDLAWVLMRWLKELPPAQRPRVIFLENVEEWQRWGPTILAEDGTRRADKTREGETFREWVRELGGYGYPHIEWRERRACDFGTPTIRRRLYLVARRDAKVVWPTPTHAPLHGSKDGIVRAWARGHGLTLDDLNGLNGHRTAAERLPRSSTGRGPALPFSWIAKRRKPSRRALASELFGPSQSRRMLGSRRA